MTRRVIERLNDMLDAVEQIELLISRYKRAGIETDRIAHAAYERFVEILSEASRHIPADLKDSESSIPWRDVANIGNYLRHAYSTVDFGILWDLHDAGQLGALKSAALRMLSKAEAKL